jgi:radical SAM superfamily enzyme YgiQ (UPF0313 family)
VRALCERLRPLKVTWSCTSRVHVDLDTLRTMRAAGCGLLIVGFEAGDAEILKHIKKGATVEQARQCMKHCKRVGIAVHGDFIIGLPGETPETIVRTVKFAQELDCETIQVSIAHAYPGTALHDFAQARGYLRANVGMTDEQGHQLPHLEYPRLSPAEMLQAVEYFYDKYYFRPRIIARLVGKAIFTAEERRRLAKAGREFLCLRARRRPFVANQGVWSAGGPLWSLTSPWLRALQELSRAGGPPSAPAMISASRPASTTPLKKHTSAACSPARA